MPALRCWVGLGWMIPTPQTNPSVIKSVGLFTVFPPVFPLVFLCNSSSGNTRNQKAFGIHLVSLRNQGRHLRCQDERASLRRWLPHACGHLSNACQTTRTYSSKPECRVRIPA